MNRITREAFVDTMGGGEAGGVDVDGFSSATQAALRRAGVSAEALGDAAGGDGRLDSKQELERVFDLLDRLDRDGSRHSLATSRQLADGREIPTLRGAAVEALKNELERARLNRDAPGIAAPTPKRTDDVNGSPAYQRAMTALTAAGFTDIQLAKGTPYYNQATPEWAKHPYPKSPPEVGVTRTLSTAGCAPCALAMADATLRGSGVRPAQVADFAVAHQLSGSPGRAGTDTLGLAEAWASEHGLSARNACSRNQSDNVDAILRGLRNGGVALASLGVDSSTGRGHFTGSGHVLLINGCAKDQDGKEWFFVVDPGRQNQARSPWLKVDDTVKQERTLSLGAGQVRISRDQLEAELRHACILEKLT